MDILPYLKTEGISPFREMVGIRYTHAENGHSQCVMDVDERLFNPGRFVHGGATFAMVDSGMGAALLSCLDEGEVCSTIDSKIAYLKAVRSGRLTCDSRVVRRSKRLAVIEAEVRNHGELAARALATFSIFRADMDVVAGFGGD